MVDTEGVMSAPPRSSAARSRPSMKRLKNALAAIGLSSDSLRMECGMGDRAAKDSLFDALSGVAKAMGNGRRAEIVDVLALGERSVDELATELGQSLANTSQHLQHLLRAGLVRTRREGTRIHYSLAGAEVGRLWASIRDVAVQHVAELDQLAANYLGDRSGLATMT